MTSAERGADKMGIAAVIIGTLLFLLGLVLGGWFWHVVNNSDVGLKKAVGLIVVIGAIKIYGYVLLVLTPFGLISGLLSLQNHQNGKPAVAIVGGILNLVLFFLGLLILMHWTRF